MNYKMKCYNIIIGWLRIPEVYQYDYTVCELDSIQRDE